jgi:ribonuclease Z
VVCIQQGVIYNQNGVKITAFLVDHGAVKPAFGYRVDYNGRLVAVSGDTRPSENLVAFSKGVDVLIHEAIDEVSLRKMVPSERLFRAIVEHHTTPEQAADIFRRVGPDWLYSVTRKAVLRSSTGLDARIQDGWKWARI